MLFLQINSILNCKYPGLFNSMFPMLKWCHHVYLSVSGLKVSHMWVTIATSSNVIRPNFRGVASILIYHRDVSHNSLKRMCITTKMSYLNFIIYLYSPKALCFLCHRYTQPYQTCEKYLYVRCDGRSCSIFSDIHQLIVHRHMKCKHFLDMKWWSYNIFSTYFWVSSYVTDLS